MEKLPYLDLAFAENRRTWDKQHSAEYTLYNQKIGELVVTSGKLIAANPFYETIDQAFELTVAPGNYPVVLSLLRTFNRSETGIFYAHVQFAPRKPVQWELAIRPSKPDTARFEVDLEAGCFMDAAAFPYLMHTWDTEGYESIENLLHDNRMLGQPWLEYHPHPRRSLNIFMFLARYDEDTFSYYGFDDDGECVCLLTEYTEFRFEEASPEK